MFSIITLLPNVPRMQQLNLELCKIIWYNFGVSIFWTNMHNYIKTGSCTCQQFFFNCWHYLVLKKYLLSLSAKWLNKFTSENFDKAIWSNLQRLWESEFGKQYIQQSISDRVAYNLNFIKSTLEIEKVFTNTNNTSNVKL